MLKKAQNHGFNFCKHKKLKKHKFNFFESLNSKKLKKITLIFASLKNLIKHGFNFLQKNARAKKTRIHFFGIYESPQDTNSIFLQAKNTQTCTNS